MTVFLWTDPDDEPDYSHLWPLFTCPPPPTEVGLSAAARAQLICPREYGGGDDRVAVYKGAFPPDVWVLICDGDPNAPAYPFREFAGPDAYETAEACVASALLRAGRARAGLSLPAPAHAKEIEVPEPTNPDVAAVTAAVRLLAAADPAVLGIVRELIRERDELRKYKEDNEKAVAVATARGVPGKLRAELAAKAAAVERFFDVLGATASKAKVEAGRSPDDGRDRVQVEAVALYQFYAATRAVLRAIM